MPCGLLGSTASLLRIFMKQHNSQHYDALDQSHQLKSNKKYKKLNMWSTFNLFFHICQWNMFTHVLHQYMRERERARGILIITQTGWCTLHGSDQSLKWFSVGLNVLWFVSLQCSMIIRIGNLEYKSTTSNIYIYI